MLVFWDAKLVFLATPKTGSTAVEVALESLADVAIQHPPVLKHTPIYRYRRFIEPFLMKSSPDPFTVVALMREPISWLSSWYRYRQRDDVIARNATRGLSFDDFLRGYMERPKPLYAQVGSQARFLLGGDLDPVDHIFCYEAMDSFVTFLEERLNCEVLLPRVNVSPQLETPVSPEVEAALRQHAADDFTLYDSVRAAATASAG